VEYYHNSWISGGDTTADYFVVDDLDNLNSEDCRDCLSEDIGVRDAGDVGALVYLDRVSVPKSLELGRFNYCRLER